MKFLRLDLRELIGLLLIFDEEMKKGFTPEEAKAESIKRIRQWWGE
jgi:hypothetical protein